MDHTFRVYLIEQTGWRDFGKDYPTKEEAQAAAAEYRKHFPTLRYIARKVYTKGRKSKLDTANFRLSRIYRVSSTEWLKIEKDYSLKYGRYCYRVTRYGDEANTLAYVPSFAEARQFIRDWPDEAIK